MWLAPKGSSYVKEISKLGSTVPQMHSCGKRWKKCRPKLVGHRRLNFKYLSLIVWSPMPCKTGWKIYGFRPCGVLVALGYINIAAVALHEVSLRGDLFIILHPYLGKF